VPRLIKFSGAVSDARGEPLGNITVRLTFAVYSEQQGGAALWAETQMAQLDEQGHYSVLLGATRADGLPVELFPAGRARWLGVQVEGRDEDPRVLLVSVPYALKAEDAAMLGGRQASDFVLGEQLKEEVRTQVAAQTPGIATQAVEMLVSNPPNVPAIAEGPSTFTCATTGDCVAVTQSGTGRALRGTATSASETLLLQQNGTGYGLRALSLGNVAVLGQVTGSAGTSYGVKGQTTSTTGAGVFGYNLATTGLAYGVLGQTASTEGTAFFGRAVATTGATIGLRGHADSTSGTGILGQATATSGTTTGIVGRVFSLDGTALVVDNTKGGKLLSGQVGSLERFKVDGSGNVYANTYRDLAGNPIGSGSSNDLNCNACVSEVEVSFNYAGSSSKGGAATSALTAGTATNALSLGGIAAANYARRDIVNTFAASQTVGSGDLSLTSGNISLPQTASVSAGVINLGGSPFIHAYGSGNTFVGSNAGNFTTSGAYNTATGYQALYSITTSDGNTAGSNTATGYQALYSNTTGYGNTASGRVALYSNTTGYGNTANGLLALTSNTEGIYNTGSGNEALHSNTTGDYNTAFGYWSGYYNTTGSENTFIGYQAGPDSGNGNLTNATAIGAQAVVSQSNSLILGGTGDYAVNVGIGTTAPAHKLDVVGDINASGGVTAASFSGDGSNLTNVPAGTANDLNCTGCVAPAEVSFNYAGSTSQGGMATNADQLDGFHASTFATLGSNTFVGNQTIAGNQSISGNLTLGGSINGGLRLEYSASPNLIGGSGGNSVTAGAVGATISGGGAGGSAHLVTDDYGTVGGGRVNQAGDNAGTTSDKSYATVGGGSGNIASGQFATVGGGGGNTASGSDATVGGGGGNTASASGATVGGGHGSTASGSDATVGGGWISVASGERSTVSGGYLNTASGLHTTVAGGEHNTAAGDWSTVPGGSYNTAQAAYTFAAGTRAKANHVGAFVWGDSTWADIASTASDQFIVRASGGARFYSSSALTTGVTLAAGGGSWSSISDRNTKERFAAVDGGGLLARLSAMPILTWNYKTQDASIRHLGPMAQDFYTAFQVGEDDKHIATVDADGVALAGVQALYHLSQEKDRTIKAQGEKIDQLAREVDELHARLARLEQLLR